MASPQPWQLTSTEIQAKIAKGELTLEAYVESLLQRIQERDERVKAWAYLNRDYALSEARRLDQVPLEKRGPLHGFVIGVKDVILTKDQPTAYNSDIYRKSPAIVSSDVGPIITLKALGALLLGKTHTSEFAASLVGPVTRNPHDPTRTPGGTSSGSGAAVGDFQVPIALGTQTLGSLIRPASYNGIYAFKPTWGAISREGLALSSPLNDTLGFYARSIADFETLADAFRLEDDTPVPKTPFSLKGAKIAFVKTHVWPGKAGPSLESAWKKAHELLAAHGAQIEDIDLPAEFANASDWHRRILFGDGRASFLGNYLIGKDKLDPRLVGHVENVSKQTRKEQLEAYDGVGRLRPIFDEIASKYDAVITPTAPDVAPEGFATGDGSFCLMWTILHVPIVNLPGFAGESGLPIGLSLVGGRYTDRHTLYVGEAIGKVFEHEGGWKHNVF